MWCRNLKYVEIPNSVEYIGKECFSSIEIEEITLPSTLKEIGEGAFYNCNSLRTVWVEEGCTLYIKKYVRRNVNV